LYDQWVAITRGEIEQPSVSIRQQFGASYVLTDLAHHAFIRQAERDAALVEVYHDRFAIVYRLESE
jgi:hypothetical protein